MVRRVDEVRHPQRGSVFFGGGCSGDKYSYDEVSALWSLMRPGAAVGGVVSDGAELDAFRGFLDVVKDVTFPDGLARFITSAGVVRNVRGMAGVLVCLELPERTFSLLAQHEDVWVREGVAGNPYVNAEHLHRVKVAYPLGSSRVYEFDNFWEAYVRRNIACHPRASAETLSRLAYHPAEDDVQVVDNLVRNPHTPSDVLRFFAGSDVPLYGQLNNGPWSMEGTDHEEVCRLRDVARFVLKVRGAVG